MSAPFPKPWTYRGFTIRPVRRGAGPAAKLFVWDAQDLSRRKGQLVYEFSQAGTKAAIKKVVRQILASPSTDTRGRRANESARAQEAWR